MIGTKILHNNLSSMRDVEFRREYDLFYVKKRKGFYDVLQGVELKLIGTLSYGYGQWCFCPCSGRYFHYGLTRSDAVKDWMASGGEVK